MRLSLSVVCIGLLGLMIGSSEAMAQTVPSYQLEKTETVQLVSSAKRLRKDALSAIEELDLSETQQTEIDSIQANMVDELADILTDDQMDRFTTAQANGDDMRRVMRGLGLTSSQRSSVMSLMRDTQSQIMDVLTPEQRAELEEEMPRDR